MRMWLPAFAVAAAFLAHAPGADGAVAVGVRISKVKVELEVDPPAGTWEQRTTAVGIIGDFRINDLLTVFVELGPVSTTVTAMRDGGEDSRAFNDCFGYAFGVTAEGELRARAGSFWAAAFRLGGIGSADYANPNGRDSFSYKEFGFAAEGRFGVAAGDTKVYGGVRLSGLDGELEEVRTGPGARVTTINFDRDGILDLLVGARTDTPETSAFVEMSILGSFGFTAGVAFKF